MRITVSAVIDALGGTAAVARRLGVLPSAVSNWRRLGLFPPRLAIELRHLAVPHNITIPDPLFRGATRADRDDYRCDNAAGAP